jgi:hypothetical protein
MSRNKRLQQPGPLTSRSFAEQAIPVGESGAQFAPPGLQIAQSLFHRNKFFGRKFAHALARRAAAVSFAEDLGQLPH